MMLASLVLKVDRGPNTEIKWDIKTPSEKMNAIGNSVQTYSLRRSLHVKF